MKNILAATFIVFISCSFFTPAIYAQAPDGENLQQPVNDVQPKPNNDEWHQIYLDKPAKSIEGIQYNKNEQPVEGELSKDRMKVYLKNYDRTNGSVTVKLTYQNGTQEDLKRSSCFIDPVPPL